MPVLVVRTPCGACTLLQPNGTRKYVGSGDCRECHGVGYFTRIEGECTGEYPQCPVSYDSMCDGWECSACGRSGPCNPKLYNKMYGRIDERRA
jgi:hypothetical protein